jgi:signal transduction histidine kinase
MSLSAERASIVAATGTAAVGAFVLAGWIWDVESLKTIYGPITMKANTAVGLLLCGTALLVLRRSPGAAAACATVAGAIGALTLVEHLSGWDVGIDQLLFTEAPGAAATVSPNRMGPNASTNFVIAATALLLLARAGSRGIVAAQSLALIGLVPAMVAVAGYVYGAEQLYGLAAYTGIALHTAIAFVMLHVGIMAARPHVGPAAVFLSAGPAGQVLRGLALPVVAIPLLVGYVEVSALNQELVDRGLANALSAVTLIAVLSLTVWHTARVIERSDRARRKAEDERDRLVVSERHARAEAERASALKDQFLATLSHELRTPLNVMLGWTHILERGVDPGKQPHIVGLVAKNGRLLVRLVEDLLDHSRVSTGQLEISRSPTSLNAIVQSSIDAAAPLADAKGLDLSADLDDTLTSVDADGQRLQQIVWNLLSNAVKFTPAGGRVHVRTAMTDDAVVLTVADSGIGFDQGFARDLFKPFRQADSSSSREHGGLGLGLSIARHIARLHGGSLTAWSPGVGGGATFTLTLPRMPAPMPSGRRADETVRSLLSS